jgi:hypothetical protein
LVSIESVMCAAEIRIHYNGILTRNPHDNPLTRQGEISWSKVRQTSGRQNYVKSAR